MLLDVEFQKDNIHFRVVAKEGTLANKDATLEFPDNFFNTDMRDYSYINGEVVYEYIERPEEIAITAEDILKALLGEEE